MIGRPEEGDTGRNRICKAENPPPLPPPPPPPPRDIGVGRPARGSIEINRRGDIDLNRYDATSKYAPSRRQTAAMNSPLLPTRALFSDAATLENEFKNTREMVPSKVLAIAIVKIRNVGYGRGVKRKAEIF